MDEGILEVSELAGDRVVELRVVDELRVVGLITCDAEGIVRGDEGPVSGVARCLSRSQSRWSTWRGRTGRRR